jgi:hypothetical protein
MAMFPRVQSPCPYKDRLASVMDGEHCRICKRDVIDLTHMTDGGRREFISACEGEVCVIYKLPLRPALVAAAMAASVAALPAAAQDAPAAVTLYGDVAVPAEEDYEEIIVGGIKDPKNTEWVEDTADAAIPELPVVVEPAAAPVTSTAAGPARS